MSDTLTGLGIALCFSQSATFSGLNLAVLGFSRLRRAAAAESGDRDAARVLTLRRDANLTLTTILWTSCTFLRARCSAVTSSGRSPSALSRGSGAPPDTANLSRARAPAGLTPRKRSTA